MHGGRKTEYPHIHGENIQTPHRKAPAEIQTGNLAVRNSVSCILNI